MRFRSFGITVAAAAAFSAGMASRPAAAQGGGDAYIGQLMLVGFTYCPVGWAEAAGQTMQISQNSALYSLFGTTYGGDGQSTFALPNLQSRIPIGQGQGPGLSNYVQGQNGGGENVTLSVGQMPTHTHIAKTSVFGTENDVNTGAPSNAMFGTSAQSIYASQGQPDQTMSPSAATTTVTPSGGNQPVNVMNPYLALRWCVALQGIYPSRP